MAEVNPEIRVPFALDPIHAEMWLREENPSVDQLESLIETQPESGRPALRRLLDQAREAIDADGGAPESLANEDVEDAEIEDDDEGYAGMTVEELRDEIRTRNESRDDPEAHMLVGGIKDELVTRLEEDDAANLPTASSEAEAAASADAIDSVLDDDE